MNTLSRFRPDEFTLAMAGIVILAFLLPCRGAGTEVFEALTSVAIALLFFLQGARLSRAAIVAGALHWRLHLLVFAATFALFPIVGFALRPLASGLLTPPMLLGLMFLCTLPSTVQASVAFTSIAGGNVAAALCSASASSLIGMVATPLLVGLILHAHGGFSLDALRSVAFELLAPFLAGKTRLDEIGADDLGKALGAALPWDLARRLDDEAPTHFRAPTGTQAPIDYKAEGGPAIALRMQELFGLKEHPSLAGGRIPLTLELLSPAHRPVQITRDLPGFWRGSWAAVRADLRGSYPRHFWPEDPAAAAPTARAKPRGT